VSTIAIITTVLRFAHATMLSVPIMALLSTMTVATITIQYLVITTPII
jgi:hypothetical protein